MNKSQPKIRSCESRAPSDDFWLKASEASLNAIWDNPEVDVYAELLEASMITSGGNDEHIRRNN
jgi:hypothetical protein